MMLHDTNWQFMLEMVEWPRHILIKFEYGVELFIRGSTQNVGSLSTVLKCVDSVETKKHEKSRSRVKVDDVDNILIKNY